MGTPCDGCGGDHEKIYLHSRCHIEAPTWAILDQEKSEVEIVCAECEKPIVKFKVLTVVQ